MNISNELLAAYAENTVSDAERSSVRQYLVEHPNELESVMVMMDEDYELTLDDENEVYSSQGSMLMLAKNVHPNLYYSAAAFVPQTASIRCNADGQRNNNNDSFDQCLGDFINETLNHKS
ncbi:MAG: hypothetical protein NC548_39970 [Lachnospiraceae bacterium]|nr:hypothetical protein [Lachnospiraceae bacterium]